MEIRENDIILFQKVVKASSGYDFSDYSISSLRRRLTRIMLEQDGNMNSFLEKLATDSVFCEKMCRKITVHTTELFRDPQIWRLLHTRVFPSWKNRDKIHIWHPGCSSGQEVYSMMMVLDELGLLEKSSIYASDLNPDILEKARQGSYKYHFNQSYLENFNKVFYPDEDLSPKSRKKPWKKYMTADPARDLIQMNKRLCSLPVYKKIDLVQDSNLFLVNFDLIVCRNVIIYFNQNLQNRVFDLFYHSLKTDGMLLLGVHEALLGPWARRFDKNDPFYIKKRET